MTPIKVMLRLTDGSKPVMGKIYDRMCSLGAKIEESEAPWKDTAKEYFDKRWEYLHSPMHAAGYALDPEHLFAEGDLDVHTNKGLQTVVERLCLADCIDLEKNEAKKKELKIDSDPVQERVAACMIQFAEYRKKEGPFAKKHVMIAAKQMAPATWWKTFGSHLPILKSVAVRVLSQTVCASAAERNWSVYGKIKSKERSRMTHDVGDKRVYCHEALHLKQKRESPDYEEPVEKWDTDDDSDESDDEDLAQ